VFLPRQGFNPQTGILLHGINILASRLLAGARGLMDEIKRDFLSNPSYEMVSSLLLLPSHLLSAPQAVLSVSPGLEMKGAGCSAPVKHA